MNPSALRLYLVTDRALCLGRPLEWVVEEAVAGGVTMVQLREKDASTREFIDLALRLRPILAQAHVPLLINDRVDIALAVDADGVHLGQSDMPYPMARRLLGPSKIIGLSVESLPDARAAAAISGLDYLAVSPVYSTPTKTDTAPALGLPGVREIAALSPAPVVGIGGLNLATAPDVIAAGAAGVAVVSAICSAPSPRLAATTLLHALP